METKEMLKNIGGRTNGDIYFGVVGPVRTGKSTFIKKFMEVAILPNIENEQDKKRAIDELPQSGSGKTIMTTEPKFVPNNAVNVKVSEDFTVNVRMVDCVGYVFDEAKGFKDEDGIRMIKTPWFEESIPFNEAAKIGTSKVINDHSTIGFVITTDGTITDIERPYYLQAEEEVINELQKINKPFIVIINSKMPEGPQALETKKYIKEKYGIEAMTLNIEELNESSAEEILKTALYEFPVSEINLNLVDWLSVLDNNHWLKATINKSVQDSLMNVTKLKDVGNITDNMKTTEEIRNAEVINLDVSTGKVEVKIDVDDTLYDQVLKEVLGYEIKDRATLLSIVQDYAKTKNEYGNLTSALENANNTGYGFAIPSFKDVHIDKPTLSKQAGRYGIKLKAKASALHLIKVDLETTFEPIIGSKEQSEELLNQILSNYEDNQSTIFDMQVFGRKVEDVIKDGINGKITNLPETTKLKLQNIMKTLSNKSKANLIAFVF